MPETLRSWRDGMNRVITREEIAATLQAILIKRFGLDWQKYDAKILDEHFFGEELRMAPRNLLYIFVAVEQEFGITIPEEDVVEGRFTSFNNIVGIIEKQLLNTQR